jgi:hypothetical protein
MANSAILSWFLFIWSLQRLFFGALRALEIEALYERGWIVATEWLFAMSTFRGEFGVETGILFLLLIVAKMWGWICEGRIDTLDHQIQERVPRDREGQFGWLKKHWRLIGAVTLNLWFVGKVLWYCAEEVMLQARLGVMMMFLFEWSILLLTAVQTTAKYGAWAYEQYVLLQQQKQRIEELRRQVMEEHAATAGEDVEMADFRVPEEDLDIHDLDLPGWESKGQFLFILDILVDVLKVLAYLGFFGLLTTFYGLPFYIIRDLYVSVRSLFKRITDYYRYQKATKNMNARYADATREELLSDNTCIICREEMDPWHELRNTEQPQQQDENGESQDLQWSTSERQRPKKLPCGHILHFYCLRSWFERQQTCPTCRRSVLVDQPPSTHHVHNQNGRAALPRDQRQQNRGANNDAGRQAVQPGAGLAAFPGFQFLGGQNNVINNQNPNNNNAQAANVNAQNQPPQQQVQPADQQGQQANNGGVQIRIRLPFMRMDFGIGRDDENNGAPPAGRDENAPEPVPVDGNNGANANGVVHAVPGQQLRFRAVGPFAHVPVGGPAAAPVAGQHQNQNQQHGEHPPPLQQQPQQTPNVQPLPTATPTIPFPMAAGPPPTTASFNLPGYNPAMDSLLPVLQSQVVHTQLSAIETQLNLEIQSMKIAEERVTTLKQLQRELDRLRREQDMVETRGRRILVGVEVNSERLGDNTVGTSQQSSIPEGLKLPEGWKIMPLSTEGIHSLDGDSQHTSQTGESSTGHQSLTPESMTSHAGNATTASGPVPQQAGVPAPERQLPNNLADLHAIQLQQHMMHLQQQGIIPGFQAAGMGQPGGFRPVPQAVGGFQQGHLAEQPTGAIPTAGIATGGPQQSSGVPSSTQVPTPRVTPQPEESKPVPIGEAALPTVTPASSALHEDALTQNSAIRSANGGASPLPPVTDQETQPEIKKNGSILLATQEPSWGFDTLSPTIATSSENVAVSAEKGKENMTPSNGTASSIDRTGSGSKNVSMEEVDDEDGAK